MHATSDVTIPIVVAVAVVVVVVVVDARDVDLFSHLAELFGHLLCHTHRLARCVFDEGVTLIVAMED